MKKAAIQVPTVAASRTTSTTSPLPAAQLSAERTPSSNSGLRTLSSYLDLDKTMDLPQKEIEAIWRLRHVNDAQSLCATIPLSVYQAIEATAKTHPRFILPLPKEGQGAEIHFA